MIGCHYHRRGVDGEYQLFESTADTRSNWDPAIQHGSPPLALLTKAIEELTAGSGLRVGRLTLDILGAIPVAPVRVRLGWTGPGHASRWWPRRWRRPGPTGRGARWRG